MKKYFLIFALLGTGLMFCGCEPGKDATKPADTAEIMEDQFQPQYGDKDPIALDDAKTGGTFTTWEVPFPNPSICFWTTTVFPPRLWDSFMNRYFLCTVPIINLLEYWQNPGRLRRMK